MRISIIITTYKRRKDLQECLKSILFQTYLPREILIVDNGSDEKTERLIKENLGELERKNVLLKYLKNDKENSLTVAKNIGVKNTTGDIVLFLDDDVILDEDYLREILKVYEKYPDVVGVEGHIKKTKPAKIRNTIYNLFFLYHLKKNECKVLPSACVTYPYPLTKIISCQWLSGVSSYKIQIFKDFKFDEKLKKYSDGEDLEFSYRVFKKYPGSLYITPYAKLVHKTSLKGRILGKELIEMREVYGLYLFYKLLAPTFKNKLIYFWSRIGRLIITLARAVTKRPQGILAELRYLMAAYYLCLSHIEEIKHGKLEFFNRTLS